MFNVQQTRKIEFGNCGAAAFLLRVKCPQNTIKIIDISVKLVRPSTRHLTIQSKWSRNNWHFKLMRNSFDSVPLRVHTSGGVWGRSINIHLVFGFDIVIRHANYHLGLFQLFVRISKCRRSTSFGPFLIKKGNFGRVDETIQVRFVCV